MKSLSFPFVLLFSCFSIIFSQQCRNLIEFPELKSYLEKHNLDWDSSKIKVHYGDTNRYTLIHRLGRGSFAEGYVGYDLSLNKQCVVKVYHNEDDYDRIFRELIILDLLCEEYPPQTSIGKNKRKPRGLKESEKRYLKIEEGQENYIKKFLENNNNKKIIKEEFLTLHNNVEENTEKESFNSEEELEYIDEIIKNNEEPNSTLIKRSYYKDENDLLLYFLTKNNRIIHNDNKINNSINSFTSNSFISYLSSSFDFSNSFISDKIKKISNLFTSYSRNLNSVKISSPPIPPSSSLPSSSIITSTSPLASYFTPSLHNNYIVKFYDIIHDTYEATPGLIFEYINASSDEDYGNNSNLEGISSVTTMEDKKKNSLNFEELSYSFSLPELKFYFRQLFYGLSKIHEHNIIHRDMKPENIIMNYRNKYLKIIDFSLSRFYYPSLQLSIAGTTSYMAPEILMKYKQYHYTCDVWSVGIMLFRILFQDLYYFSSNSSYRQLESLVEVFGSEDLIKYRQAYNITYRDTAPIFSPDKISSYPRKSLKSLILTERSKELVTDEAIDFIEKVLNYDHNKRYTAKQCLEHPFLQI